MSKKVVDNLISNEQLQQWELDSLADRIGNDLELNNDFLNRYCGKRVADLLSKLPERERAFALDGCIEEGFFPGTIWHDDPEQICLPHDEIEFQFEGDPKEVFVSPEELTINGQIAYLYTGYGAVFPIDCDKLAENVAYLQEDEE